MIFTTGATESNNLTLKGIAYRYRDKGQHIVTSASEHKAVLDSCHYLERLAFRLLICVRTETALSRPIKFYRR
ncbi:aminotransferase class V-fold PLP-dependent enzyme [Methylotuvimicrobium sp. KM1]|uniref:aminotransferase class V-fold PLP-dependent enzyme n=1 Tax=Methylotuvimicrobium sp. KM1 TaxID=3377707 RepID=UPI00384E382D